LLKIFLHRKTATLKFGSQGEALITLKNMKELPVDGLVLALNSKQGSDTSLTVHIKENNIRGEITFYI